MNTDQKDEKAATTAEDNLRRTAATQPRGNPETDHESVRKGEEQLDKVSGH